MWHHNRLLLGCWSLKEIDLGIRDLEGRVDLRLQVVEFVKLLFTLLDVVVVDNLAVELGVLVRPSAKLVDLHLGHIVVHGRKDGPLRPKKAALVEDEAVDGILLPGHLHHGHDVGVVDVSLQGLVLVDEVLRGLDRLADLLRLAFVGILRVEDVIPERRASRVLLDELGLLLELLVGQLKGVEGLDQLHLGTFLP